MKDARLSPLAQLWMEAMYPEHTERLAALVALSVLGWGLALHRRYPELPEPPELGPEEGIVSQLRDGLEAIRARRLW